MGMPSSPSPWASFGWIPEVLGGMGRMTPWHMGFGPIAWKDIRVDVLAGDGVVILRLGHKEGSPLVEVTLPPTEADDLSQRLARFATMAGAGPEPVPSKKGK